MNLKTLVTLATLIGIVFSAYFYLDSRYALARDLQLVEVRLEQKINSDQINNLQRRIWSIEDRYRGVRMPEIVAEELRELKLQVEQLKSNKKKEAGR